jgi:hypothetical protein
MSEPKLLYVRHLDTFEWEAQIRNDEGIWTLRARTYRGLRRLIRRAKSGDLP